ALPTSLATALVATALVTGRGLAAVRSTVLREGARTAAATAAGTTAALTLTVAMTKKILLTSLAVACTVVIGVFAWPEAPVPPAPERTDTSPAAQGSLATFTGTAATDVTKAPVEPAVEHVERTALANSGSATWPV